MALTQNVEQVVMNAEIPADVPEWVQLLGVGMWRGHPTVGTESITAEHLQSALDYFSRHYVAHSAELVIDYHHASAYVPLGAERAPAGGWIKEMELRAGGAELWGRVQWTTVAMSAIGAREYRYLSPVLRFNKPDRVTGQPVPLQIHSMALTNTPFLTELESLNEATAAMSGAGNDVSKREGVAMNILTLIATALGIAAEQVASQLGLGEAQEDKDVANAIMGFVTRVGELPTEIGSAALRIPEAVANALGVAADADQRTINTALIRLKAPGAGMFAIRKLLGLAEDATDDLILNSIGALQDTKRTGEAEELVEQAVKDGKVPPANRDYYLQAALNDLEATRAVLNTMPVLAGPSALAGKPADKGGDGLTDSDRMVMRTLGVSKEVMLRGAGA